MDDTALKQFLQKRTRETWDTSARPYYLAMVQPELTKQNETYKDAVGDKTLSEYAGSLPGLKLIRHPEQKAKIGLIPDDVNFEFPENDAVNKRAVGDEMPRKSKISRNERIVCDFLRLMSRLDEKDIRDFQIPAIIIARMMRD